MNIPDHISQGLEAFFGFKILKFLDADPGSGIFMTLDPLWKKFCKDYGSDTKWWISVPGRCAWPRVSPAVRASWRVWDSGSRRTPCSADGSCGEPRRMCGYAARCGRIRILNTRAKNKIKSYQKRKNLLYIQDINNPYLLKRLSELHPFLTYPPPFSLLRPTIEQRDNRDAALFEVCFSPLDLILHPPWKTCLLASPKGCQPSGIHSAAPSPYCGELATSGPCTLKILPIHINLAQIRCISNKFTSTVQNSDLKGLSWDKIFFNIKRYKIVFGLSKNYLLVL